MENAGEAVANHARRHWSEAKRVLLLCGKGNNGGDGYVAARRLVESGIEVAVLELSPTPTTAEAQAARAALLNAGLRPDTLDTGNLTAAQDEAQLIIDALLGSGLSRAVTGELAELLERINQTDTPVLSVDVPSGLSADFAEAPGMHLQATRSLQLAGTKLASFLPPAQQSFGETEVADIGIPAKILIAHASAVLLDDAAARAELPRRAATAHKYSVGTVLVVAGSAEYLGAAELACRGAYRAGAGLVTLAAEARLPNSWPEIIFRALDWSENALQTLSDISSKRDQARVIGPGLDVDNPDLIAQLIARSGAATVLDAGALLPGDSWREAVRDHGSCVLTPHAGEAARLLGLSSAEVSSDPVGSARTLSSSLNAVTVLKGATTAIAAPNGRIALSPRGHPGMATGGAGDVLAGVLGALVREAELFESVTAGVYLHGLAGELAAAKHGYGLVASDIAEALGKAWLELEK